MLPDKRTWARILSRFWSFACYNVTRVWSGTERELSIAKAASVRMFHFEQLRALLEAVHGLSSGGRPDKHVAGSFGGYALLCLHCAVPPKLITC